MCRHLFCFLVRLSYLDPSSSSKIGQDGYPLISAIRYLNYRPLAAQVQGCARCPFCGSEPLHQKLSCYLEVGLKLVASLLEWYCSAYNSQSQSKQETAAILERCE